jgi:hypothetical protein
VDRGETAAIAGGMGAVAIAIVARGGIVADATIVARAVTVVTVVRGVSAKAARMKVLRLSLRRRS